MDKKMIILVSIVFGLVVGLALGIFVSVVFNLPSSFHNGVGVNNQVQVSGTVSQTQNGTIKFISLNGSINTSVPIIKGGYSVLLIGGQSYNVFVYSFGAYSYSHSYSLYVPLGVTTFTANF